LPPPGRDAICDASTMLPDALRSTLAALPQLAKFAIALAVLVGTPPLARRVRIPPGWHAGT
jgi:hypothetical protein